VNLHDYFTFIKFFMLYITGMEPAANQHIAIVGCGPGAAEYLTAAAQSAAADAMVLAGAPRLLQLFPTFTGERLAVDAAIENTLTAIAQRVAAGARVTVLVTGDPGLCSLAQPILRRFGREACRIIPGVSSVQMACARLGLDWTAARIISAHAAMPAVDPRALADISPVLVLGGNRKSWPWILAAADHLASTHRLTLCRNLTLPDEELRELTPADLRALPPGAGSSVLVWVKRPEESNPIPMTTVNLVDR